MKNLSEDIINRITDSCRNGQKLVIVDNDLLNIINESLFQLQEFVKKLHKEYKSNLLLLPTEITWNLGVYDEERYNYPIVEYVDGFYKFYSDCNVNIFMLIKLEWLNDYKLLSRYIQDKLIEEFDSYLENEVKNHKSAIERINNVNFNVLTKWEI